MKNWLSILTAVSLGLLPTAAYADGCFKTRTYYAPTYSYAAPTYYNYQYVPKVVEAVVVPNYYYDVGPYLRDKNQADLIVGRIAELLLKQGPVPGQPGTQQPDPGAAPMTPLNSKPQIEVVPQQQGRRGPGAYQNPKLLAVVNASCVKCHDDTKMMGGLNLVSGGKLADLTSAEWNECFVQVSTQEMPKGGKPVADADTVPFREAALAKKQAEAQVRK